MRAAQTPPCQHSRPPPRLNWSCLAGRETSRLTLKKGSLTSLTGRVSCTGSVWRTRRACPRAVKGRSEYATAGCQRAFSHSSGHFKRNAVHSAGRRKKGSQCGRVWLELALSSLPRGESGKKKKKLAVRAVLSCIVKLVSICTHLQKKIKDVWGEATFLPTTVLPTSSLEETLFGRLARKGQQSPLLLRLSSASPFRVRGWPKHRFARRSLRDTSVDVSIEVAVG